MMMLLLLLPIPIVTGWPQVPRKPIIALLGIVLAQFLLFYCLLKWQYWHVRLIVAMPVLRAPVIAWVWTAPRSIYAVAVIAVALIGGLLPSINCATRPFWGPRSILHATPRIRRIRPQQFLSVTSARFWLDHAADRKFNSRHLVAATVTFSMNFPELIEPCHPLQVQ